MINNLLDNLMFNWFKIQVWDPDWEMYEEKTGYQIKSEWNLYMGFNLFKLAAISQGIMGRVRDGTAAGKNADSFGENAVMMADEAWKLINE